MANDYMAKLAADLDGMTMGGLASKGRYGDTMIAHVNPQEAQMLMEEGGSGTINPMTGLPEFFWSADTSADDDGSAGDQGAADYSFDDAMTAAELGMSMDEYGATLGGVGTGEPGEFAGGDTTPYTDEGLGGDKRTLDPYKPNVAEIRERLEKEGFKNIEESILYTKILEQTGQVSKEGLDTLANLLATPGVEQAMLSGFRDGYQYGGLLEDTLAARDNFLGNMSGEIKAAEKKVREGYKEQEDRDALGAIEEVEPEETNYFGDIIGDIVGGVKDYFTGPSREDELAYAQAVQDAGFTFSPISDEVKYFDKGLGYVAPGPIGFAKGLYDLAAFATDSRIIGDVDTPYGTFQLTESGDLTAPNMFVGADDFGNEPTITKKRKAVKKPVEEEEKEKEEDKPYFPEISTATLTPAELRTLTNIYGPDTYLLNRDQTGLRALV